MNVGTWVMIDRLKKDAFIDLNVFFSEFSQYHNLNGCYIAKMSRKNFDFVNTIENSHIFKDCIQVKRDGTKERIEINRK